MEILRGLYRSRCKFLTTDNYGGNKFDVYSYSYLLFLKDRVFTFSIKGYTENFEVKNVFESILNEERTILEGIYELDEGNTIICDFEFKPFMAGKLKMIGKKLNNGMCLIFDKFSNGETFLLDEVYCNQDVVTEINQLKDRGVKQISLNGIKIIELEKLL